MGAWNVLVLLTFVGSVVSYSGQFVPKSYYIIDHNGHQSDVVYFRSKRAVELFPLLRMRRSSGGASASSQSSAKASSSSNSNNGYGGGGGGGGAPLYTGGDGYNPGVVDPGFGPDFDDLFQFGGNGGGGGGGNGGYARSFAGSSSSSSSGYGSGYGGNGGGAGYGGNGGAGGHEIPTLFSRVGEDTGTGVRISSNAAGPRGAFSSSASSIDSDGKITYATKSGKY